MSIAREINYLSLHCLLGVLLVVGIFFSHSTCASISSLQDVTAEEKQKIIDKFKMLHKDMNSISASITQEKQLVALKKKVFIEGTVLMAKPNMLKWDIVKPERSLTLIDGETMTVYHPDSKEAQIYTLAEKFITRNTLDFFLTAMSGDLDEMEKKFSVNMFRKDNEIILKLVPLSNMASRYIASIVISYDEGTGLPSEIELTTPKGDKTVTKLTNIKVNPDLSPQMFKIKLPADVWITNKPQPGGN